MIKVGIAGSTGYTGAELIKLIMDHPGADLVLVTSKSYENRLIADIFPGLRRAGNLRCEAMDIDRISGKLDLMFLALPHRVSMAWAPQLYDAGIKVIDLSADFRFKSASVYESAYQEHTAAGLLKEAVYGLCEVYGDDIPSAGLIGNPGCYPTSILLPLVPLLEKKLISCQGIVCDAKSGVSGAGRSLSLGTHFCEINEGFKPYKVEGHRHTPEIEAVLSQVSKDDVHITFVPHLLPLTRGMLSTIYARVNKGVTENDIRSALTAYYEGQPFIRIFEKGVFPDIAHVRNTNCCDIGVHVNQDSCQAILVSAIDNLLKGAAGQAVQNMNLMYGLDQATGLTGGQGVL